MREYEGTKKKTGNRKKAVSPRRAILGCSAICVGVALFAALLQHAHSVRRECNSVHNSDENVRERERESQSGLLASIRRCCWRRRRTRESIRRTSTNEVVVVSRERSERRETMRRINIVGISHIILAVYTRLLLSLSFSLFYLPTSISVWRRTSEYRSALCLCAGREV